MELSSSHCLGGRTGVINNNACRQAGMHRLGVETEEVHACMDISASLLLSAAAHLAIKNVLCALFVPQRAELSSTSLLSLHHFRMDFTKSIHTRHTPLDPAKTFTLLIGFVDLIRSRKSAYEKSAVHQIMFFKSSLNMSFN